MAKVILEFDGELDEDDLSTINNLMAWNMELNTRYKFLSRVQPEVIVNFAGRDRKLLTHFLDTIRNYERESHNLIGFDERETSEFIDIYFENDYSKISE